MKSSNGCCSIEISRSRSSITAFDGIKTDDADEINGLMSPALFITDATAVADAAAIPVAVLIDGVLTAVEGPVVDCVDDADDADADDDDDDRTESGLIFFNFEQLNFKLQFAFFIFSSLFISFEVQQVQDFDEFCANAKYAFLC